MPRINLRIFCTNHIPALAIGREVPAVRFVTNISLARPDGWTRFDPAVIDTGAPVCLFPPAIWRDTDYESFGRVQIGGISRRSESQVPAMLARVTCRLSDGDTLLGPLTMQAYLAENDDAPTLIGILGFLEHGLLRLDLSRNTANLSMK